MEIKVNNEIRIESNVPYCMVEHFSLEWEPNCHAQFNIIGYIESETICNMQMLYGSKILVLKEKEGKLQTIFYGIVSYAVQETTGKIKKISLEAKSGTCILNQKLMERSYQSVDKTYAEVAREAVKINGGKIICIEGNNKIIGKPFIQYQETAWEFCKRLASHLGTCIVADIFSGESILWFGMNNEGNTINFLENEFNVIAERIDTNNVECTYETKSREVFRIGDKVLLDGQQLIICSVSAVFAYGELMFRYRMKYKEKSQIYYLKQFTGLGLLGIVSKVQGEQVNIALDIDGGASTGDYLYNWYPETGNAMYAMPEVGTRVMLCFAGRDEQEGFALHCINTRMNTNNYKERDIQTLEGNVIDLCSRSLDLLERKNSVTLWAGNVSTNSSRNVHISAKRNIHMQAGMMIIQSPEEINFCQG